MEVTITIFLLFHRTASMHGTASEKVSSFQNDDDDNNNSDNNDDDTDCDNKINQSHETMI